MDIRLSTTTDVEGIRVVGHICSPETYSAIAPPGYVEAPWLCRRWLTPVVVGRTFTFDQAPQRPIAIYQTATEYMIFAQKREPLIPLTEVIHA